MSPGQAVKDVLAADAGVVAVVGQRVFPSKMPPNTVMPAVVYAVVSQNPEETFDGAVATDITNSRVQVDCYATKYAQAHSLAEKVEDALAALDDGFMTATKTDSRDLFEDDTLLHRVSMDFSVWRGR